MRRIPALLLCILFMMSALSACKKEKEEDLLVDGGDLSVSADQEAAENPVYVNDSEIYNTRTNYLLENEESVFFMRGGGASSSLGVLTFLAAADRVSGAVSPICSKPDCTHDDISCTAYTTMGGTYSAVSASDEWVYYTTRTSEGRKLLRRKLPDGAEETIAIINYDKMLPEHPDTVFIMDGTCIYDGDYYSSVCAGVSGDEGMSRESELYATVYRVPVSSGREERTVFQEKVTGYDGYQIWLMPRSEGLYIIVIQSKTEYENDLPVSAQVTSVYLYTPETERSELIFLCEDPFWNLNIHDRKLFFVRGDSEDKTCLYTQDFSDSEPTLLAVLSANSEDSSETVFYRDGICTYDFWDTVSESYDSDVINIQCFSYDGKLLSRESVNLPDTVKPEHSDDYIIPDTDGMLNGGSMLIGSDSYALYFKGDYTSWDRTKREDFYYGITLDGQRVLIFTEKK